MDTKEIEARAKRTERRLIDAGLDHSITDDILALLDDRGRIVIQLEAAQAALADAIASNTAWADDAAALASVVTKQRSEIDLLRTMLDAAQRIRPMLAKLADDNNWFEATWFEDREPCTGFFFTGENEKGQTCDANEYAKDILAAFDGATG